MSTATTFASALVRGKADAPATSANWLLKGLLGALQAARSAAAERVLRDELAEMDEAQLRDIGICEDEIYRVRRRERFTPKAWTAAV